ncbi:MAG: rhomboid family intramembrane serine protease [Candidatus Latescibacteria bacterium]|nr:rhomboid family intramembrane serine protease [Candidatus Latescibacterota bacterium]
MFPLYSDRPLSRFPFVTLLLIIANTVVFVVQMTGEGSVTRSVMLYGMIPYDIFHPGWADVPGRIPTSLTVISSMFSHGGFLHLAANMLYLWVFGRNVEDDFGRVRFLLFYLSAGILASLAFAAAFPSGTIPLVGASGAIAGVLGVYFLRFPFSRIYCLVILFIFIRIIPLPAFIMLGFWFVVQLSASMTSVATSADSAGHGGVAWITHVAGFVVGIVWTILEMRRRYYARKRDSW